MYALHSERSLGSGDLTDLRTLARWQAALGARVVGSLPMLAVYLDEPFDPSPYAPVSRMFWNELFVDPKATPEFAGSAEARRRAESKPFVQEADSLSAAALVQYRRQAALRRQLLEPCAERFFERGGQDTQPYRAFLASNPDLPSYARFRAVMERQKVGWAEWSARLREGQIRTNDFDPAHERYHLYAQFCFDRQFSALKTDLSGHDALVYLDLPVGVRRDGYDVWRDPGLFADGAKVGAPADPYFSSGQDWGFPPMLPEASGEQGHESFARSVRAHMRHADFLRLDHVMAFHRLYWIPPHRRGDRGAVRHVPARGAVRDPLPREPPQPVPAGGREPGHGPAGGEPRAGEARDQRAVRHGVRGPARPGRGAAPGPGDVGRVDQHPRHGAAGAVLGRVGHRRPRGHRRAGA
jgi:4-alpha-glucanotransferase